MSQFDNFPLETIDDYKFFALTLGEKLRNPNFTPEKRELFFKSLIE